MPGVSSFSNAELDRRSWRSEMVGSNGHPLCARNDDLRGRDHTPTSLTLFDSTHTNKWNCTRMAILVDRNPVAFGNGLLAPPILFAWNANDRCRSFLWQSMDGNTAEWGCRLQVFAQRVGNDRSDCPVSVCIRRLARCSNQIHSCLPSRYGRRVLCPVCAGGGSSATLSFHGSGAALLFDRPTSQRRSG